jgi:hypothetical protein
MLCKSLVIKVQKKYWNIKIATKTLDSFSKPKGCGPESSQNKFNEDRK